MTKQITKAQQTELATAMMEESELDAGVGFEDMGEESYAIPFLKVLQKLSPQCDDDSDSRIEGAKPGQIFNTVSEQVLESVTVIPCYCKRTFLEWVPRDSGGGFAGEHKPGDAIVKETEQRGERDGGKFIMESGNELMDTRSHYVLIVNADGTTSPAIISMSSSQIKVSRRWNSVMADVKWPSAKTGLMFLAPMFGNSYELTTRTESKGEDKWKGWVVSKPTKLELPAHYIAAKEFHVNVRSGDVNVDYNKMGDSESQVETESDSY